jgi:hypothetical protein
MRGLIQPREGCGIAYIDFTSQEIGIAAALSGDERMADGYQEGDPYLAFAKAAQACTAGWHPSVSQDSSRSLQSNRARHQLWNGSRFDGRCRRDHSGGSQRAPSTSQ